MASSSNNNNQPSHDADNLPACQGVRVQKPAPYFSTTAVINGAFKTVSTEDIKGKYTVIFFYPLDWTFVCPTELTAFSDRVDEFAKLNCQLLAVSVDSEYSHLAWCNVPRNKGGLGTLNYPLLADVNKNMSRSFGVLLEQSGVSLRGLFVLDKDTIVRHVTINDLPIGRSVDETLRVLKALQFVEEHGEVCPANWTPGKPTMKAHPEHSQEYFSKVH